MRGICTLDHCSARRRGEKAPLAAARRDLEFILLSEVGQTEKDKCHIPSLLCVEAEL